MKDPSNHIYRHNLNVVSFETAEKIFKKKNRKQEETKQAFNIMNAILPLYEKNK